MTNYSIFSKLSFLLYKIFHKPFRLCLVPENLKENANERKYKGKIEGKKK